MRTARIPPRGHWKGRRKLESMDRYLSLVSNTAKKAKQSRQGQRQRQRKHLGDDVENCPRADVPCISYRQKAEAQPATCQTQASQCVFFFRWMGELRWHGDRPLPPQGNLLRNIRSRTARRRETWEFERTSDTWSGAACLSRELQDDARSQMLIYCHVGRFFCPWYEMNSIWEVIASYHILIF